jgi:hypothetical protein
MARERTADDPAHVFYGCMEKAVLAIVAPFPARMRGPYRRTLQFRFRRSSFSFFWISTYGECKQYGKSAGPQPRGAPLRVDLRSQLASSGVAPGAPHAISGRPLCRPSRPFVGPIFKGSKGSNSPVRQAVGGCPLICALPSCTASYSQGSDPPINRMRRGSWPTRVAASSKSSASSAAMPWAYGRRSPTLQ